MSDDMEEAEKDERSLELSTLSAIYPELLRDSSDPFSATIDIPVEPVRPIFVFFPPSTDGVQPGLPTPPDTDGTSQSPSDDALPKLQSQSASHANLEIHELSHLPPVQLRIHLPRAYPDEQPPELELISHWIPAAILKRLEKEGNTLWEDIGHSQVLFAYIDHLRETAEEAFGLQSSKKEAMTVSPELRIGLLDYDLKAKQAIFDKATYECDIGSVKCISPKCGQDVPGKRRKRDRTLGPSELLQIPLETATVQRYVMLKRKNALESDRTTVYCPRQWCQGPARSKKTEALDRDEDLDSDDEQLEHLEKAQDEGNDTEDPPLPVDRLAICTQCTYAFCKVCKAGWHGDFLICDPKRKAKMTAEEEASEEYIRLHTSHCPTCNATSQKTHGCNHMICFKCNSHFCYLCSSWLDQNNPYEHFNNPKKACFQRLWELEAGDGADVGRGFAGGYESDGGDDGFDGQDDNPLANLDDVDSDDEAFEDGPPVAPPAPPPRNHPHRQHIIVRLPPPPRVQAAIERRAAAAPAQADDGAAQRHPEPRAPQAAQAGPARAPAARPPRMLMRRRPVEGLQRALEMVQNDEEDEWDSDELGDESDDDDFWQIPFR
ncbi:MAG: hypothetical protein Q9169_003511 [Polycauliona sp. 2 TL-2023]